MTALRYLQVDMRDKPISDTVRGAFSEAIEVDVEELREKMMETYERQANILQIDGDRLRPRVKSEWRKGVVYYLIEFGRVSLDNYFFLRRYKRSFL